ncbi:MAG: hypothetical protein HKM98_00985, partial [Gammaproteobacteria bacterium]|nr:hypothetical protein [Gammaproteobacteria bacterium]
MLRILWKWLATGFSIIVILLAVGIGLFRLLLPMIPQYHERIEAFASEAAGTPVLIEGIDARWGRNGPELRFRNAQLLTADGGASLLTADTGSVVLDLKRLISEGELQAGRILLGGLKLEVKRSANGDWQVGGIRAGGGGMPKTLAVGLRGAQMIFNDEMNGVGPWLFDEVDLDINLKNQDLKIAADFELPVELGERVDVSIEATGDLEDRDALQWRGYFNVSEVLLAGWADLMPREKASPVAGSGALTGWISMQGEQLQQASLMLDTRNVVLAKNDAEIHRFDQLKGRFEFDSTEAGWEATGRDIVISSDGQTWPASTFGIEQVGTGDDDGLLYADIDYARLQDLAPFSDWIPDEKIRDRLTGMAPRGVIEDLSFRLVHEKEKPDDFSLRTRFSELGANATGDWPGFDLISGDIRMDSSSGRVELEPAETMFDLPGIIGVPVKT